MKINRQLFYISMLFNAILLIVSSLLFFRYQNNDTVEYIVNILLNIFAGSVILSVTSLVGYFNYKKNLLRDIMNDCLHYSNLFAKITYFNPKKYDYNDIKNVKVKDKDKYVKKYKNDIKMDNVNELKEVLIKYLSISEINTKELWNKYDDLYFLINSKKKRMVYWEKIFNYIYSNIKDIRYYQRHFNIYLSEKNGNYRVNEEMVLDLQKKIFSIKDSRFDFDEKRVKEVVQELDVGYKTIYHIHSDGYLFIYNKVADNLIKMFDYVNEDANFRFKFFWNRK